MNTSDDRARAARPPEQTDGRNSGSPQRGGVGWRSILLFVALFILNYTLAAAFFGVARPRVTIPYSPNFITQVRAGNVATVTARGADIEGTLKHAVTYAAPGSKAVSSTDFATRIPAFADTGTLDRMLGLNDVVVTAKAPLGTPWWETLLVGFGPTLLFIGLWVWLLNRNGGGGLGGMFSFGSSKAKKYEPTKEKVTFVDVAGIDAIGRSRSSGAYSGANDEREQTLNQILTEMDGFEAGTGVIVLAATNRPDVLDSALLRPGRFDRRVPVQAPDKGGRAQIPRVHTREVPLAPDVDIEALAATTAGMVGADLANLANEAALLAARRQHEQVTMSDFSDALEKIELGTARKLLLTEADKRRTAYHEAGHALSGMLTPGADPVRKISIIPRTMSLGVTVSAPDADRFNYDKEGLLARIRVATGGRAAEEVVYGNETTGAESDIRQATSLARNMVGRFGMSEEIGFLSVLAPEADGTPAYPEVSERTRQRIDDEMRRIVGEAHEETVQLLSENRDRLESLATALFETETLEGPEAYAAAGLHGPAAALPAEPATLAAGR